MWWPRDQFGGKRIDLYQPDHPVDPENYAEPLRIADLAAMAGMSASAYHRHFAPLTEMSPLQFQKRIRLQEARALLVAQPAATSPASGHLVGYDSPTQFSRGVPPHVRRATAAATPRG